MELDSSLKEKWRQSAASASVPIVAVDAFPVGCSPRKKIVDAIQQDASLAILLNGRQGSGLPDIVEAEEPESPSDAIRELEAKRVSKEYVADLLVRFGNRTIGEPSEKRSPESRNLGTVAATLD